MLNKLSRKNKQKFGFQLAIAFLNNGASVKEIENVYETPAVHVGLRMFLETGRWKLYAQFLKKACYTRSRLYLGSTFYVFQKKTFYFCGSSKIFFLSNQ